jgi:hypothetical protein
MKARCAWNLQHAVHIVTYLTDKEGIVVRYAKVPAGIQPKLFDNLSPKKIRARHAIEGRPIVIYTGVLKAFL